MTCNPKLSAEKLAELAKEIREKYAGGRNATRMCAIPSSPAMYSTGYSMLMEPPHCLTREQIEALTVKQADALLAEKMSEGDGPQIVEGKP